MDIEFAIPANMSQTGSSLLKILMNEHTPVLDLLVRESVQNTLDACHGIKKFVELEYLTGEFDKYELSRHFEKISKELSKSNRPNKFLAIRDRYTKGLTGKLNVEDVVDNDYGNLVKLVYQVCKPQDTLGAGGSWGVGKTIYSRLGIGLVIYYSRIFIYETQKYENRLVACLVEDEKSEKTILPQYKQHSKCGIAWWGKTLPGRINKTIPILDDEYIEEFLNIFNIHPYTGTDTGTTVIIPYIDEQALLKNNQPQYETEAGEIVPFWRNSIEEYLNISLQRWYAPRLDNPNYKLGKKLVAKINGKKLVSEDFEPIFQLQQALYNRSTAKYDDDFVELDEGDDFIANNVDSYLSEGIKIQKVLKNTTAGTLAFCCVSKESLGIKAGQNCYSPYIYLNQDISDTEHNAPILSFCRKPGMIVSYVNGDEWLKNVAPSKPDKFIIGVFSLNSNNELSQVDMSLEEYVRKCEMGDHATWDDCTVMGVNPFILKAVKRNVSNKIANEFNKKQEVNLGNNSDWENLLGSLLLPPEDYGDRPSVSSGDDAGGNSTNTQGGRRGSGGGRGHGGSYTSGNSYKYRLLNDKTEYVDGKMVLYFEFVATKPTNKFGVSIDIDTDGGKPISLKDWSNSFRNNIPFKLDSAVISFSKMDGAKSYTTLVVNSFVPFAQQSYVSLSMPSSYSEDIYSVIISCNGKITFTAELKLVFTINSKNVSPLFKSL